MAVGTSFLQRWLVLAAFLRMFSVYLGFFNFKRFQTNLFDGAPDQVTELYGRTFAVWTALSCTLCLICARNPCSRPIYAATLASFALANLHFLAECFVYGTMSWKGAITPFIVSGFSVLWMGFGWNYYTNEVPTEGAAAGKDNSKSE